MFLLSGADLRERILISTTKKAIRLGKQLKYELLLIFENFQGLSVKTVFEKLPEGYCSKATVYNYHRRWKQARRKYAELVKHF